MSGIAPAPPCHEGAIRSLDDLRTALTYSLWGVNAVARVTNDCSYLRGKRTVLKELLERLDWPDSCDKCGDGPVIDRIEQFAMCHDCIDEWNDAQDLIDGETA